MSYSISRIFSNGNINATLDRINYELEKSFNLTNKFGFTGRAAALLQGEDLPPPENVVFITNDATLYDFVQKQLPNLIKHKGVTRFKERTLFNFDDFFLEIWKVGPEINLDFVLVNNVYVQPVAKMPVETL